MGRKSRIKQEGGMEVNTTSPKTYTNSNNIIRLIADIKKDSIASINTVSQPTFERLLNKIFTPSTQELINEIKGISSGGTKFIDSLHQVERSTAVFGEENYQLNILASDLVHACASDAIYVFPETGLSPSKAVIDPKFVIGTAAGYLDPGSGSTEINYLYIPDETKFDDVELMSVGFPAEMNWNALPVSGLRGTAPEYLVSKPHSGIFYDVTIKYPKSGGVRGVIEDNGKTIEIKMDLKDLCKGNAEKNALIESGQESDDEKINLLLTKELGDVAQVLVYDHFVQKLKASIEARQIYTEELNAEVAANPGPGADADAADIISRQKSVMITTDHVVYMLCKEKNLSCIYTGAQKLGGLQRESGHTHIVTYTGVKLSNEEKIRKTMNLHKTNLIKYLENKKFLITLLLTERRLNNKVLNIKYLNKREKIINIHASGINSRDGLDFNRIYTFLEQIQTSIKGDLEKIKTVDLTEILDTTPGNLNAADEASFGSFVQSVDNYFSNIKGNYDEKYDLITYNKQTRQFFSTPRLTPEKIRGIITIEDSGGEPAGLLVGGADGADAGYTAPNQLLKKVEYSYTYDKEKVKNNVKEKIKQRYQNEHTKYDESLIINMEIDNKISLESAILIYIVEDITNNLNIKASKNKEVEKKNIFSVLYEFFKRELLSDVLTLKDQILSLKVLSTGEPKYEIQSITNFIIFTGRIIAFNMGFYSQDFFSESIKNKEQILMPLYRALAAEDRVQPLLEEIKNLFNDPLAIEVNEIFSESQKKKKKDNFIP